MTIDDKRGQSPEKKNDTTKAAEDQARRDAGAAGETLKSDLQEARREAETQAHHLADEARGQVDSAIESARSMAGEQKNLAAGQVNGIADAVDRVAGQLSGDQQAIAGQLRNAANGLHRVADSLKTSSVEEIVGMAEDFGRRQPAAFIGVAALAGLAASRFLSASAKRRQVQPTAATSAGGYRSDRAVSPQTPRAYSGAATPAQPRTPSNGGIN